MNNRLLLLINTIFGVIFALVTGSTCSQPSDSPEKKEITSEESNQSAIDGSDSNQSSIYNSYQISLRPPGDKILSGVSTENPNLTYSALSQLPVEEVEKKLATAIEIVDITRSSVPLTIEATLDRDGVTEIAVIPNDELEKNQWYELLFYARPPEVILQGGESEWKVDFYTGHLVQVSEVVQGDPPKNDVLYIRMTEDVDFDFSWAERLFFDDVGTIIPGCVQFNGACSNSGRAVLRELSVVLLHASDGALISHIASIDATDGPSSSERTRLDFKPCIEGGSRCAFLEKSF